MSYENYEKALSLAPKCKCYMTTGGKSEDIILSAEQLLNIVFSKQHRDYCSRIGYMSFFGHEIFEVGSYDSPIIEANTVAYALHEREKFDLPEKWLPIYNFNDGNIAFFDYTQTDETGEPPIIMAINTGKKYVLLERLAEDFGDFLLDLVEMQLDNQ